MTALRTRAVVHPLQQALDARHRPPDPRAVVAVLGHEDLRPPAPDAPSPAGLPPGANVLVTSREVLVGPVPLDTGPGCARCVAMRWQRLRERCVRDALEISVASPDSGGDRTAPWPPVTAVLADSVHAVLARHARPGRSTPAATRSGARTGSPRRVVAVSIAELTTRVVGLLPDPLCPDCGGPPETTVPPASAWSLERPLPKAGPTTYRLRDPRDFPLDEDALANPVCGAIGLRSVTDVGCPTLAPVNGGIATRNAVTGLTGLTWGGQAHRHSSSRRIGMLEGLERYSAAHCRRPGTVVDSYDNLRGRAVHPDVLGRYPDDVVAADTRLTPFDPARPIAWVPGWSLRDRQEVLVPAQATYFADPRPGSCFVLGSSNGCASGGSRTEAVLHGLLEVVERDAFVIGWYGGLRLPGLDLAACPDPEVGELVRRADLAGHDVHVFDNRIDLPVPVATAVAVRRDGHPSALNFAAGAAPTQLGAVRAALGEATLPFLGMAERSAERSRELNAMADDYTRVRALHDHADLFTLPRMVPHAALYLTGARPVGPVSDRPWNGATGDLRDDVTDVVAALADAGHDVIAVDQTSPEQQACELYTVKVFVPGLVPIDFGWHKQRALTSPRLHAVLAEHGARFGRAPGAPLHEVPHPFP